MNALRRRERGSATMEFVGLMPLLFICAVFAWQMLLIAATVTAAENAARTGSRAAARGGSGGAAAMEALPGWLQSHASPCGGGGTRVSVCVEVPLLWPGVGFPEVSFRRTAELPPSL